MALILRDYETLIIRGDNIKDFDLVNYVLASALKSNFIEPENLGLVI